MKLRHGAGWSLAIFPLLLVRAPLCAPMTGGPYLGSALLARTNPWQKLRDPTRQAHLWLPLPRSFSERPSGLSGSLWAVHSSRIPTPLGSSSRAWAEPSGRRIDPSRKPSFLWIHSRKSAAHLVEWTVALSPLFALTASSFLDHRYPPNDAPGMWQRSYQLDLEHGVMAIEGAGALWLGGRSRLGRTFWQALDSSLFTAITTTALKYAFSRARPFQSSNPHDFFQGNCCQSFPSGEVAFQASFVTPFIAEYAPQNPWVWGLEVLPLYDALGRMRARGHWQTDVIAGWAIGTAWGIYAHEEKQPFVLGLLPGGFMVGLHETF